jgi:ADP-ribosyl-[dinitrogen reductase] hydrolase
VVETDAFTGKLAFGPVPRSLADVRTITDWDAGWIISVLPQADMARRGAADLPSWIAEQGIPWLHLPIVDYRAPDVDFDAAWIQRGPQILQALLNGDRVFVHCAAGLGRSGTVVARLLIEAGMSTEDAIIATRKARPGAIEMKVQEAYLRALRP